MFFYRMLIPEIRSIQTTSQSAIAATTTYRIHCPAVFGSVRFSTLVYATLGSARRLRGLLESVILRFLDLRVVNINLDLIRTRILVNDIFRREPLFRSSHGYWRDSPGKKSVSSSSVPP